MHELKAKILDLKTRFEAFEEPLNLVEKKKRLEILELESAEPNLWDDQDRAKKIMQELGDLKSELEELTNLQSEIGTLAELAQEGELSADLEKDVAELIKRLDKIELQTYMSGKYDAKNAIVSIHAGQGGTEAMDWVSMLFRMYMRYCERKNWAIEVIDQTTGEEAGIKSIVFKVDGKYVYGFLKNESGAHRLVRQSPFNADNLRQTSFALVDVMPELDEIDLPDVVIRDDELDWQFFRASGQGGQNVQKVSSAVRLKHIPTGLVVTAQTERFQEQNRKYALALLRAKLWAKMRQEAKEKKQEIQGEYTPATWGTQIRSYVLHPYKMIKDLRTDVETSNTEAVLDGDLDSFIEAELRI